MRGLRRGLSLLVSGFLLVGLITGIAWSADIYVSPTGTGAGSITKPTNLQAALDLAKTKTEDVTIYLQQGTYTSSDTFAYEVTGTNINAVTLSGGWNTGFTTQSADNTLTVLDGESTRRVLRVTGDGTGVNITFTTQNLTIENGLTTTYDANGDTGYGAGIFVNNYNSSHLKLIINNCLIQYNNASSNVSAVGGAIFITCDYEIDNTTFYMNQAYHYGGAIYSAYNPPYTKSLAPVIDGCTFDSNRGLHAGGSHIFNQVSLTIKNSNFYGLSGGTSSGGSGINSYTGSFLTLENCIFSGNVTDYWSGAIQFWYAGGNITNTLFINNKAGTSGDGAGGVMDILWNYTDAYPVPPVVNITNCTFAGNSTVGYQGYGGAITQRGTTLNIVNSIFWNNGGTAIYEESGSTSITYSDIYGGHSGTGNINSDPKFVDTANGDYSLQKSSPCIDKGNNSASVLDPDLAGNARIFNSVVDMGPYEAQPIIAVSPNPLNFGGVLVGHYTDKPVTVQNNGTLDLVLGDIGNPGDPFTIVTTGSGDCEDGQTLASGESCTITARFPPVSGGTFSTSFNIASNDLNHSTVQVDLNGAAVHLVSTSPGDGYECTACSYYTPQTFQWDTDDTFKSMVFTFYPASNPKKTVKVTVSSKTIPTTLLFINSATWKKILLLPGTGGGTVAWNITGTMGDKAKTKYYSPDYSMTIDPPLPVGNPGISPTSKTGLPTLTWDNNCASTFKVWFGSGSNFSGKIKKTSLSLKVANPNDNGVFTQPLTSKQWTAIRKLVGDVDNSTLYWYVESTDILKRVAKTGIMDFTLNP